MISIKGLNKAAVLAALYNASHPQGRGLLHYDPSPMTDIEAASLLRSSRDLDFEYVKGRVIKVNLSGDEFDPRLYDRDNGYGAAERALMSVHATPPAATEPERDSGTEA